MSRTRFGKNVFTIIQLCILFDKKKKKTKKKFI